MNQTTARPRRITTHPRRTRRQERAAERSARTPAERLAVLRRRSDAGYELDSLESLSLELGEYIQKPGGAP